jgi:peptide deformylase
MKLPVYLYGHPVLRELSVPVANDYPDLKELVANMFETMYASEGVGLAAPQVGKNIDLVVIDADPVSEAFPECKGRKFAVINPELEILDGEKVSRAEGCLSVPGISEDVKRVEHIRLKWYDEDFQLHEEEMHGFLARIVQHELDHLDGALYIDHISPLRKQFIRNKLHNIIEGKTRCDYPVKYAPRKRR